MSCCCAERKIVRTTTGQKAIGPYSLGVQAGHLVFTAGQVGFDPATGAMVPGGLEAETRQALENMKAILEAAGTSLANVVKTTVFLRDIKDFQAMNAVYGSYFPVDPPARSAFQVAALPAGAIVEIECVALVPPSGEDDCCCDKKE
jgi:2-iminobutanoate/2-iminopropanoate deaminase